jgi:hypothetical protein
MKIKLAALLEGFVLVNASRIKHEKKDSNGLLHEPDTNRLVSIQLKCEHHHVCHVRGWKTARKVLGHNDDTKDDCCPSCLVIYLHKMDDSSFACRWFLSWPPSAAILCPGCHLHTFQLDTEDLCASTTLMSDV